MIETKLPYDEAGPNPKVQLSASVATLGGGAIGVASHFCLM